MIVVKELRCRGCEGRLFVGDEESGWRCVVDGFEGVFVDVLRPDPPRRKQVVAAKVPTKRGRRPVKGRARKNARTG